ncbi:hypothetical protein GH714_028233 [Hevea brasiliensis]|uniref:Phytochrome n=1 Tax=Hevea brasiliensis TaxID=3981 RepID=A0A6A6MRX6_HEVBR|nr:hypothetical protein GH714_028233 [Hevea brasiliensis]
MGFQSGRGATTTLSSSAASSMRPLATNSRSNATIAQYNADAGLLAEFEQSGVSGKCFNYSRAVLSAPNTVPEEQITAYLSRIQRGGLIQSLGCMLAIEEPTFRIIGFSENCFQLLGLSSHNELESKQVKGLIGIDARTLFTPQSGVSLTKAAVSREISMLNPIWVHSRSTQKPFYAILHRIDVGIVIDLEPARSSDPVLSLAGAVQSQKLAVRAISRMQSLPGGDIGVLCDTVVEDVQKLTGYDRVMVYKFHDDDHGEVVSEIRRSDLEPYLGLHYPATDIPQAARFLFKQNRVRMICDCRASPVRIIQSEELKHPLCLVNSTLRSPHGCHTQYMANMGSIASLAFGLQLYMELQLAAQLVEKKILRTQTLLCDMLLRDAPFGIVTQSPSIMDLVKCDGAALYYGGKCWLLGITPTESQVKDIAEWLLINHGDSTGLSTDSLAGAGYPGAALLGDAVCGIATARITSRDFLFWFRSHTAKEVKWGGAKHHQEDKDDGERMHPRSSFNAFLEVVKSKSLPWEVSEINAIHSLQLIIRDSFPDMEDSGSKAMVYAQQKDTEMRGIDELSSVACEMVRLIETATAPIFGVDSAGLVNGWNAKVAELTGLQTSEAMGKSLVHEIVHEDSCGVVEGILGRALQGITGQETEKFPFGFFNRQGKFVEIVEPDLQQTFDGLRQEEQVNFLKLKELAYIRQEMKNPLSGIRFTHKLLEDTAISEHQKQFLETSDACEKQIMTIIEDMDLARLEEGNIELKTEEFLMGNVLDAIVSQVMILLRERNIKLFHEIPEEIKTLALYGDQIRLQLILSDILLSVVQHAPSPDGWVEIKISPGLKMIQDGNEFIRLQIRMTHMGKGLPSALIQEMFEGGNHRTTQEGLVLNLSRKLLNKMNGHVHYTREHNKCYFLIDLELKLKGRQKGEQADTSNGLTFCSSTFSCFFNSAQMPPIMTQRRECVVTCSGPGIIMVAVAFQF